MCANISQNAAEEEADAIKNSFLWLGGNPGRVPFMSAYCVFVIKLQSYQKLQKEKQIDGIV